MFPDLLKDYSTKGIPSTVRAASWQLLLVKYLYHSLLCSMISCSHCVGCSWLSICSDKPWQDYWPKEYGLRKQAITKQREEYRKLLSRYLRSRNSMSEEQQKIMKQVILKNYNDKPPYSPIPVLDFHQYLLFRLRQTYQEPVLKDLLWCFIIRGYKRLVICLVRKGWSVAVNSIEL